MLCNRKIYAMQSDLQGAMGVDAYLDFKYRVGEFNYWAVVAECKRHRIPVKFEIPCDRETAIRETDRGAAMMIACGLLPQAT